MSSRSFVAICNRRIQRWLQHKSHEPSSFICSSYIRVCRIFSGMTLLERKVIAILWALSKSIRAQAYLRYAFAQLSSSSPENDGSLIHRAMGTTRFPIQQIRMKVENLRNMRQLSWIMTRYIKDKALVNNFCDSRECKSQTFTVFSWSDEELKSRKKKKKQREREREKEKQASAKSSDWRYHARNAERLSKVHLGLPGRLAGLSRQLLSFDHSVALSVAKSRAIVFGVLRVIVPCLLIILLAWYLQDLCFHAAELSVESNSR